MVSEHILEQVEKIRALPSTDLDVDIELACDAAQWLGAVLADRVKWKLSLSNFTSTDLALEYCGITAVRAALDQTGHPIGPSICGGMDILLGALKKEAQQRGLNLASHSDPDLERRAAIAALHICLSFEEVEPSGRNSKAPTTH